MEEAMDALKAECEAKVKEIKAKQDKYTEVMLGQMRAMKADNLETAEGVVRVKEQTHVNAADWPAIWRYIAEHNKWQYLQKRLTSSEILKDAKANAIRGENGREILSLPPGMSTYTDYKLTVAKPAGRKALPKDDEGAN
jgi:thymidine phosphorylase